MGGPAGIIAKMMKKKKKRKGKLGNPTIFAWKSNQSNHSNQARGKAG
jgi:hypothetical protein